MSSSNTFQYPKPQPLGPRKSQFPQDREQKEFLKNPLPELPSKRWKGVKILGVGGFGTVGLWKRRVSGQNPNYVAVKTTNFEPDEYGNEGIYFDNEGKWHWLLNGAQSQHIVGLLMKPKAVQSSQGLNVEKLYTEYCPMGSLRDLISRRKILGKPFAETTLWLFLNCIIDGLSVLSYGQECTYDEYNKTARGTRKEGWVEICHYDLHSSNFFLGEFNTSHTFSPVIKVADFGESDEIKREKWDDKEYAEMKAGACSLPELEGISGFDKWDKVGSTTKSNIWQSGLVMASMALLDDGIGNNPEYSPGGDDIKGWIPKGITYIGKLKNTPYSSALRQIIFECMYKDTVHRPGLLELKERIQEGWRVANQMAPGGEPWADFAHPDPDPPEWDPDAWDPDDDESAGGKDGEDDDEEQDEEAEEEEEDDEQADEDDEDGGAETRVQDDKQETGEISVGNSQGEDTKETMETEAVDTGGNSSPNEQGRQKRCRIQ